MVLYETVTNRIPASHSEATDALTTQSRHLQPKLREIIARLLERDRALRYQTASDVVSELRRLKRDISSSGHVVAAFAPSTTPVSLKRSSNKLLRYGLGVVALAAICVPAVLFFLRKPVSSPLPLRMVPFSGVPCMEDDLSFSPDGKQAAFSWNGGSGRDYHIYLKLIGAGPSLALTSGPGFDSSPAWSPDSRYIAYTHDRGAKDVMVVSALGGTERRICSIDPVGPDQGSRSLTWTPDGASLLISDRPTAKERPAIFYYLGRIRREAPFDFAFAPTLRRWRPSILAGWQYAGLPPLEPELSQRYLPSAVAKGRNQAIYRRSEAHLGICLGRRWKKHYPFLPTRRACYAVARSYLGRRARTGTRSWRGCPSARHFQEGRFPRLHLSTRKCGYLARAA